MRLSRGLCAVFFCEYTKNIHNEVLLDRSVSGGYQKGWIHISSACICL